MVIKVNFSCSEKEHHVNMVAYKLLSFIISKIHGTFYSEKINSFHIFFKNCIITSLYLEVENFHFICQRLQLIVEYFYDNKLNKLFGCITLKA